MRSPSYNPLAKFLNDSGIRPESFAFFVSSFIKEHNAKRFKKSDLLKIHLSKVLVAQAELIQRHLERVA